MNQKPNTASDIKHTDDQELPQFSEGLLKFSDSLVAITSATSDQISIVEV